MEGETHRRHSHGDVDVLDDVGRPLGQRALLAHGGDLLADVLAEREELDARHAHGDVDVGALLQLLLEVGGRVDDQLLAPTYGLVSNLIPQRGA